MRGYFISEADNFQQLAYVSALSSCCLDQFELLEWQFWLLLCLILIQACKYFHSLHFVILEYALTCKNRNSKAAYWGPQNP